MCSPGSKAARPASQRKLGARSVACGWSAVPTSREPMPLAGSAGSCPGAVAIAQANNSESSTVQRRFERTTARVTGGERAPDRSATAKSQTNLVWSVRSACFATQEQTRRAHGYCGGPGRAKPRGPIAGLGRYAEHRALCWFAALGAPLSVPVSAVCGRRNEREHPAKSAKLSAAANGAGGKLTSPASGAGGTVRKR